MNAPAENLCLTLRTQAVRDLAWACFSPSLLNMPELATADGVGNCVLPLTPRRREWLQALDRAPESLLEHLSKGHSTRLGLYFEALWQFLLQHDDDVTLLEHNLPVRAAGRTLGEFDCLYYCKQRQRPVHLELAVKFYLQETGAAPQRWLGPNSADRLDLKVARLLSHQIRLSETVEGAQALAQIGVNEPLREIEIKGRLFQHMDTGGEHPWGYNDALPMQTWCHQHQLTALAPEAPAYCVLARDQWLAPVAARDNELLDRPALCERLLADSLHRPLQAACFDASGAETQRFFVVSNDWPVKAWTTTPRG